jgi:hypothetical protein
VQQIYQDSTGNNWQPIQLATIYMNRASTSKEIFRKLQRDVSGKDMNFLLAYQGLRDKFKIRKNDEPGEIWISNDKIDWFWAF